MENSCSMISLFVELKLQTEIIIPIFKALRKECGDEHAMKIVAEAKWM